MNKFIGKGRLTRDPEIRYSQGQNNESMIMARYTLAINRRGKKDEADFINCVAFGKNGEFAEKYLKKGQEILICGRVQTGSYTNKDGQKVYTTDIIVDEHEFCGTKSDSVQPTPTSAPNSTIEIPDDIMDNLPFK